MYGYTQMVNSAILTNSSYKLRFAQDIDAVSRARSHFDLAGFDLAAGKQHWLEDPIWQGARQAIESIMGASDDYLEQYFRDQRRCSSRCVAELLRAAAS